MRGIDMHTRKLLPQQTKACRAKTEVAGEQRTCVMAPTSPSAACLTCGQAAGDGYESTGGHDRTMHAKFERSPQELTLSRAAAARSSAAAAASVRRPPLPPLPPAVA